MSSSWYKSLAGNIIHFCISSKVSTMSLNFGDISGVEPREITHEESDLEDEVFFKIGEEGDLDKTNKKDNNETVPVVTPPPLVYSDSDEENDDQTSTPARKILMQHFFDDSFASSTTRSSASSMSITGADSSVEETKIRRGSYTIAQKLEALKKIDLNQGNLYKSCRELNIKRQTLQGWVKMREKIENASKEKGLTAEKIREVSHGDKRNRAKFVQLESDLVLLIEEYRESGNAVHCADVKRLALNYSRL